MKLLALDTATPLASVALLEDGQPAGLATVRGARGHAGHLLETVRFLLGRAGWDAGEPDLFVATCGPGSFTGLRIGIGTIEGLALAAGRPACGVSTLGALVETVGPAGQRLLPFLDAGRGELFAGLYSGDVPPRLLAEERALKPADLPTWLAPWAPDPSSAVVSGVASVVAFGWGAERWAEPLRAACPSLRLLPNPPAAAIGAGLLAARLLARGKTPADLPLTARYLRRADARLPGGVDPQAA